MIEIRINQNIGSFQPTEAVKDEEQAELLRKYKDTVIVLDSNAEFFRMVELLGGEVIRIAPGCGIYRNPFDIELNREEIK